MFFSLIARELVCAKTPQNPGTLTTAGVKEGLADIPQLSSEQ